MANLAAPYRWSAKFCATFIPSALVYYGLLPQAVVASVSTFYHDSNILYLYICCIIVGSTLSMNRTTLIQGFLRIFIPMLCGEAVGMLFLAIALKLLNGISPSLLAGSQVVYKFFQTAVTYPILFAVGVAMTSCQALEEALTLANLLVIVSTVLSLVMTGFLVGKKAGMHPIDVAIISCCQSGQGGTGDVAILSAGERMALMPFAQIATRVGGALSVSLVLLALNTMQA